MKKLSALALLVFPAALIGCSSQPTAEEDVPNITTEKAVYQAGIRRTMAPLRLLHNNEDGREVALGLASDRDGIQTLTVEINRATEITGVTFVVEGQPERLAADPARTTYRLSGDEADHDYAVSSIPIPSVFLGQLAKSKPVHVVIHTMMGDFTGTLVADEPSPAFTGIKEWLD